VIVKPTATGTCCHFKAVICRLTFSCGLDNVFSMQRRAELTRHMYPEVVVAHLLRGGEPDVND